MDRFCRDLSRARSQSAAFPISHLAAGRLSKRAYRRFDGIDGRALKNGSLRFCAPSASAFPKGNQDHRPVASCVSGLFDRLCSACRVGTARFETNGRLLVDQPSRLLHARPVCRSRPTCRCCEDRHARSVERRVHANFQSRNHCGYAVLLHRFARATPRSARHRRLRRVDAADPTALRLDERGNVFISGSAGTKRIHR